MCAGSCADMCWPICTRVFLGIRAEILPNPFRARLIVKLTHRISVSEGHPGRMQRKVCQSNRPGACAPRMCAGTHRWTGSCRNKNLAENICQAGAPNTVSLEIVETTESTSKLANAEIATSPCTCPSTLVTNSNKAGANAIQQRRQHPVICYPLRRRRRRVDKYHSSSQT